MIEGSFTDQEINYITRVLSHGSLSAKLSKKPISQEIIAPELGADNLRSSLITGIVASVLVAGFMVAYYFGSGMIAVVGLVYNFVLVVAIMALNNTAFSLPAIAGIVLTFGQAVDSNVLVYERMREEFHRGADMRTALRLGFSRALPPIVDGNVSNLIICVVLGSFGTQEIRGFAITLGIGVVTTLFSTLVLSRLLFTVLVERFHWKKASQLPMVLPFVQRLMTPHFDWMKHRHLLLGVLVAFLLASAGIIVQRGSELMGMEFRGGTKVTIQLKETEPGKRLTASRAQIQDTLKKAAEASNDPVLKRAPGRRHRRRQPRGGRGDLVPVLLQNSPHRRQDRPGGVDQDVRQHHRRAAPTDLRRLRHHRSQGRPGLSHPRPPPSAPISDAPRSPLTTGTSSAARRSFWTTSSRLSPSPPSTPGLTSSAPRATSTMSPPTSSES